MIFVETPQYLLHRVRPNQANVRLLQSTEVTQDPKTPVRIDSHKYGSFNVRFPFPLLILYYTSHSLFQIIPSSLLRPSSSLTSSLLLINIPCIYPSAIYVSNTKTQPSWTTKTLPYEKRQTNPPSDPHTHHTHTPSVRYTVCSTKKRNTVNLSFLLSSIPFCFFVSFFTLQQKNKEVYNLATLSYPANQMAEKKEKLSTKVEFQREL